MSITNTAAAARRSAAAFIAAAVLAAAVLAGCGSGGGRQTASGEQLFNEHCATCHTLDTAPTAKQQGGKLASLRLSRRQVLLFTAEMPPVHGRLSRRELEAVVDYVYGAERR